MSFALVDRTYDSAERMRAALDELRAGPGRAKHVPASPSVLAVAVYLAHRCRPRPDSPALAQLGEVVDEAVSQIAASTGLAEGTVRDCLRVLEVLGAWTKVTKGNRHRASVRTPGEFYTAGPPAMHDGSTSRDRDLHRGIHRATSRDPQGYIAGGPAHPSSTPGSSPRGVAPAAESNSSDDVEHLVARARPLVSKTHTHPELPAVLHRLVREYQQAHVEEALAELERIPFVVPWPAELDAELRRLVEGQHVAAAERRRVVRSFDVATDPRTGAPVAHPKSA